jgi:hypothetical protein
MSSRFELVIFRNWVGGSNPQAKCWYGRLLITLHRHYGWLFCLTNLNISSFIVANLFNKICNL